MEKAESMSTLKSKLIRSSVAYENAFLTVIHQKRTLPSGIEQDFFIKKEFDIVICLPITSDGKFVLVEEYRPGPDAILFEIPGGNVDEGEDPISAVKREVLEETGYSGTVTHLATTYVSAYSTSKKHIFVMEDCCRSPLSSNDPSEPIRVHEIDLTQLKKVVESGKLTDLDGGLLALNYIHQRNGKERID